MPNFSDEFLRSSDRSLLDQYASPVSVIALASERIRADASAAAEYLLSTMSAEEIVQRCANAAGKRWLQKRRELAAQYAYDTAVADARSKALEIEQARLLVARADANATAEQLGAVVTDTRGAIEADERTRHRSRQLHRRGYDASESVYERAGFNNQDAHAPYASLRTEPRYDSESGVTSWTDENGSACWSHAGDKGHYIAGGGPCGPLYVDEFGNT